jgi:hypothetical protein
MVVVTYREDVAFGSLHKKLLNGVEKVRNEQGNTQNRSVKINNTVTSLYLPASYFSFRILRLAQKIERMGNSRNLFMAVWIEVKINRISNFNEKQARYGHQVHVESISV